MAAGLLYAIVLMAAVYIQSTEAQCIQNLQRCVLPFVYQLQQHGGLSEEALREYLLEHGFTQSCNVMISINSCIQRVAATCRPHELPLDAHQGIELFDHLINFVCVQEIDMFNDNRQCLLSADLAESIESQCEEASGQICNLVEDSECSIAIMEENCGTEIGTKTREFISGLESEMGCSKAYNFKELINLLR